MQLVHERHMEERTWSRQCPYTTDVAMYGLTTSTV
jgi:hypothetical protein